MSHDAAARLAAVTMIGLPDEGLTPAFRREFEARPYAGVLLFRRHFRNVTALPGLIQELRALAAPRRILVAVDEEGGFVSQLGPDFPVPPSARVLGRAASAMEVERISATVGTWLAAMGVDVNFAPVLDVDSEPVNPVIGPRSYGGDAMRVAELGAAALRGFREGGILACAKHFPGHGATTVDSHLTLPTCDVPLSVLEERELVPFREALQLAPLVMTAHVLYPALDPDWPATLSPAIVGGWLRGKLNTRGVVVTDAMEMAGVADSVAPGQAPLQALAAGCDLILYGAWTDQVGQQMARAARLWDEHGDEALPAARWEEARGRIEALYSAALATERAEHGEHGEPADRVNLELLVPPSWNETLLAICRRGLSWLGAPAPFNGDRMLVLEPAWTGAPSVAEFMLESGIPARGRTFAQASAGAGPGRAASVAADLGVLCADGPSKDTVVICLPRRTALHEDDLTELRKLCALRPVVLVALEQDAFLREVPEAAGRLSACDSTPAMRRAIAMEFAGAASRV
jgi:beta-N-acetylhexosaminidase